MKATSTPHSVNCVPAQIPERAEKDRTEKDAGEITQLASDERRVTYLQELIVHRQNSHGREWDWVNEVAEPECALHRPIISNFIWRANSFVQFIRQLLVPA